MPLRALEDLVSTDCILQGERRQVHLRSELTRPLDPEQQAELRRLSSENDQKF